MKRVCVTTFFILLLCGAVVAQTTARWDWITDLSGGLEPRFTAPATPPNTATYLDNFVIDGQGLKMRQGWTLWQSAFDTLGISDMYMFWDESRHKKQVLAVVEDQVWFRDDDSTGFSRIGITAPHDTILLMLNDSIAYGFNTTWLNDMLPENGSDWRLYVYHAGGTVSFPIYRVLSNNHLKLDSVNTYASLTYENNFALVPSFDTTNGVQFETWNDLCFMADGTHPVRKWTGKTFDRKHYIIDSAIVSEATYGTVDGLNVVTLAFSTPLLNNTPTGLITDYADYHYSVIYDLEQAYPYTDQEAIMRMPIVSSDSVNAITVFADLIDQKNLSALQKIYVTVPLSMAYSFATDTVFSGVIDSVVQWDTLAPPVPDTILTQFGVDTLVTDADSVIINLPISYNSTSEYTVVHTYGSPYKSRLMQRKVSGAEFRIIRPPGDDDTVQVFHWIAVGTPSDADSADGETDGSDWLWQWGQSSDSITDLNYKYTTAEEYRVGLGNYWYTSGFRPRHASNISDSQFTVSDPGDKEFRRWAAVGDPNTLGEANSGEDSLVIKYGSVSFAAWETAILVYFDIYRPFSTYQTIICTADTNDGHYQDSIENEVLVQAQMHSRFQLKRRANITVPQTISWISVGRAPTDPADTNEYSLVYDDDVIIDDSIFRNEDLYTSPYLFRITSGPDIDQLWWTMGAPCTLHRDDNDTLTLRVLVPDYDYDGDTITLPIPDSNQYIVERLIQYPQARTFLNRQARMLYGNTPQHPGHLYYSALWDHNDVSPARYEVVGDDEQEGILALGINQNGVATFKRHHIYLLTGNDDEDFNTVRRSSNYGMWGRSLLTTFMDQQFALHKTGPFTFDGSVPNWDIGLPVKPFFTDSLNLSAIDNVRGTIINEDFMGLLLSFPTTGTENSETLVFDFEHQVWSTWSFAPSCYLILDFENGQDTLLAGDADSAAIYVYGGTKDMGSEIVPEYISSFMDWGRANTYKRVEKVLVWYRVDHGAYLCFALYGDEDVSSAIYEDSVQSSTSGLVWEKHCFSIPPQKEAISFAVGFRGQDVDTLYVAPKIGIKNADVREVGGQ